MIIREIRTHTRPHTEGQSEQKSNGTAEEAIRLLGNLYYCEIKLPDTTRKENEDRIDFVRRYRNGHDYPRFHIILDGAKFEIISFHIDISQHRKSTDYLSKDNEIRRLIKGLEKEEGVARNRLSELFRSELLFGNIRENGLTGETQKKRLNGLLKSKKQKRLGRSERRRWKIRKERACIFDEAD